MNKLRSILGNKRLKLGILATLILATIACDRQSELNLYEGEISYLGYEAFDSALITDSTAITIPAGTTYVLILFAAWMDNDAYQQVLSTCELNAVSATHLQSAGHNGVLDGYMDIWGYTNPSVGAYTLDWDISEGALPTRGSSLFVVYLSGVNSSYPVRDQDGAQDGASISLTIDSDINDMLFVFATTQNALLTIDPNDLATVVERPLYNNISSGFGFKAGVDGTDTVTQTGSWPGLVYISLRPELLSF